MGNGSLIFGLTGLSAWTFFPLQVLGTIRTFRKEQATHLFPSHFVSVHIVNTPIQAHYLPPGSNMTSTSTFNVLMRPTLYDRLQIVPETNMIATNGVPGQKKKCECHVPRRYPVCSSRGRHHLIFDSALVCMQVWRSRPFSSNISRKAVQVSSDVAFDISLLTPFRTTALQTRANLQLRDCFSRGLFTHKLPFFAARRRRLVRVTAQYHLLYLSFISSPFSLLAHHPAPPEHDTGDTDREPNRS